MNISVYFIFWSPMIEAHLTQWTKAESLMRPSRCVMTRSSAVGSKTTETRRRRHQRPGKVPSWPHAHSLSTHVFSALHLSACWLNFSLSLKIGMIQNGHPAIAASIQEYVSSQARQLKKLTTFLQPGSTYSKKASTDPTQLEV